MADTSFSQYPGFAEHFASRPVTPVAFGRVDREPVLDLGDFTFLTWHFVFRYSGLPAGLRWWQSWATALLGDRTDWHQLDLRGWNTEPRWRSVYEPGGGNWQNPCGGTSSALLNLLDRF